MSKLNESMRIHCDNDCQMQGCPGHDFNLHYQSTSDWFTVTRDGKLKFGADLNEMEALIETLFRMSHYRVEVAGIIKRAQDRDESKEGENHG